MKNLYTLFALIVACTLLSCEDVPTSASVANPDLPEEIYGHWRYATMRIKEPSMDVPVTICIAGWLELNADGTWDQDLRIGGEIISTGPGTWTADSTTITLKPLRGKTETWRYLLDANREPYLLGLSGGTAEGGRDISYALDRQL
jgi:hypothetical protein